MTTVYKLTRPDLTTHAGYQWALGERRTFPGTGSLCARGWAHAYTSPALALFLNSVHAQYVPCRLFEGEGRIGATDHGLKVGCSELMLTRELPVPEVTSEQRVTFETHCALAVYTATPFVAWAEGWLSGQDRSAQAAQAAARAAQVAAARAAARAARAAQAAAWAAAWAAQAAQVAAARAAARAAQAAVWAAQAAAQAELARPLDLDALAAAALLPWTWETS